MKTFRSTSPHDGKILGVVSITPTDEVASIVQKAHAASPAWRALGVGGRVVHMRSLLRVFAAHAEEFAKLITSEMGMPLAASVEDVASSLTFLAWYIDSAEQYLQPEVTFENAHEVHRVHHEPYGVAAVITPWNYPASNFVWGCGQNLLAGNTVVFKHSEETPLCGKLLEKIIQESGLPEGVCSEIFGRGPLGALLARQPVDLICFTGSTQVGKSLYRVAAQNMLPIVLELGGSAPGIVAADADLHDAVAHIFDARFDNSGQSCDGLKRLIVHEDVWDPMIEKLVDRLSMVRLGDPNNPQTTMGPLVSRRQVEVLERQVADALEKGAQVVVGGKRPGLPGAYYEPTILTDITPNMRVWKEEVFGPVLPVVRYKTEAEAIALANDTEYGLGGYVYTRDAVFAERVSRAIDTGMVSVNGVGYVRPQNPFGGYKHSGLGRQQGRFGFASVTQTKVIAQKK